jgi:hypothetical protein
MMVGPSLYFSRRSHNQGNESVAPKGIQLISSLYWLFWIHEHINTNLTPLMLLDEESSSLFG